MYDAIKKIKKKRYLNGLKQRLHLIVERKVKESPSYEFIDGRSYFQRLPPQDTSAVLQSGWCLCASQYQSNTFTTFYKQHDISTLPSCRRTENL